MKPNVFFRADGNSEIGLGHVIRSLALADILKEDFECIFLIQSPTEFLKDEILKTCTSIISLDSTSDYVKEAEYITQTCINASDIVVLDGYSFKTEYQETLKNKGAKLICIDDLYQWHFVADAIINHTVGISVKDYKSGSLCRFYLGTDYALLRRPFLQIAKENKKATQFKSVFVNMGGADPENYTLEIVTKLQTLGMLYEVHVLIGAAYQHKESLTSHSERIKIHSGLNADEVCSLMNECGIAICSASTVAYEYCCVGGLLFLIKTAENQADIFTFLINQGLAVDISTIDSISTINVEKITSRQKEYFKGKSLANLKNIFLNFSIEDKVIIRRAKESDLLTYYYWANDLAVRENSISKQFITPETHKAWFIKKIKDTASILFVFELANECIGQVRFDEKEGYWLISFLVDSKFRGRGIGELILHKAIAKVAGQEHKKKCLKAQVQKGNNASESIFFRLGFEKENFEIINNITYYTFTKSIVI